MKKFITPLLAVLFLILACNKQDVKTSKADQTQEIPVIAKRTCAANEVLEAQMTADPGLKKRMDNIEAYTERVMKNQVLFVW